MAKTATFFFLLTNTHIRIVIIVASLEANIGLQRPARAIRTHTRDTGKPSPKKDISSQYGSRETTQGVRCSLITMSTWAQILNSNIKDKYMAGVCNPSRAGAGRAGRHSHRRCLTTNGAGLMSSRLSEDTLFQRTRRRVWPLSMHKHIDMHTTDTYIHTSTPMWNYILMREKGSHPEEWWLSSRESSLKTKVCLELENPILLNAFT